MYALRLCVVRWFGTRDGVRPMRQTLSVVAMAALAIAGCGGGGGGSVDSTPSISNLQFSPSSALQYDGNGMVTVTGTFNFTDAGKDLMTAYLTSSSGATVTASLVGASGQSSGTLQGAVQIDTTTLGHFTFQLYVTDSAGKQSNTLTGAFDVNPNDTGSHWSQQSFPVSAGSTLFTMKRVRWNGSTLLAVGDAIFTSPDGVTWSARPTGISPGFNDATWTGSQFVVVGNSGAVLTSPDGATWTPQTIPATNSPTLDGIASSGTRLVAVGTQSVSGNNQGLILTSSDGVSWTAVPGTFQATLSAVVWSGSQFVAVGSTLGQSNAQAIALTSPDGVTWTNTLISQPGLSALADIAWNGSRFVAVGNGGGATSTDGLSWQATGAGFVGQDNAIAWSGQHFLACGLSDCQLSSDGLQWQTTPLLPMPGGDPPAVLGLVWSGTKWVAVGFDTYFGAAIHLYVATSP
jgi:hypothetical protein